MNNEVQLTTKDGVVVVSSRVVAYDFGKRHADVIAKIEDKLANEKIRSLNYFIENTYTDAQGKPRKEYLMTRDGFTFIVMGFTGEKADGWKIQYIQAFNKMEEQLKNQTSQLTKEQYNVLALYELGGQNAVNMALEIKQVGIELGVSIGKEQGMKHLCNNGVVTIPDIMNYIKDEYSDKFNYSCDIPSTEWTRYLRHMGYLETKHFKRKDGRGMEQKWTYQPTKMFEEMFVEQGMAIIREIDDRGKLEISYTIEIERFLLSDTFKRTFFEYLDRIYPKIDMIA